MKLPRQITSVGMQGHLERAIPGTLLEVLPRGEEAPLSIWIKSAIADGGVIQYEFGYIGLDSGSHDLSTYLRRIDGSPTPIPPLAVECVSVLPPRHDGALIFSPRDIPTSEPSTSATPALLFTGWLAFTVVLILALLRRRRAAGTPLASESGLLDEIRPLARLALAGSVSEEGRARLDRMITSFWQERLEMDELAPDEALSRLRADERIGSALREFQNWSHGRLQQGERIASLLQPFAQDGVPEVLTWSSSAR